MTPQLDEFDNRGRVRALNMSTRFAALHAVSAVLAGFYTCVSARAYSDGDMTSALLNGVVVAIWIVLSVLAKWQEREWLADA